MAFFELAAPRADERLREVGASLHQRAIRAVHLAHLVENVVRMRDVAAPQAAEAHGITTGHPDGDRAAGLARIPEGALEAIRRGEHLAGGGEAIADARGAEPRR